MSLIKNFCENPNVRNWSILGEYIQNFFKQSAKYAKNENKGYQGLVTVIYNIVNPKIFRRPKQIYGVHGLSYYKSENYGMTVYLFEDTHKLEYNCSDRSIISANDVIQYQIASAPCFVDLFLEIPYIFEKNGAEKFVTQTYMGNLHKGLISCFRWSKHDCEYPNLRAHYIDIRSIKSNKPIFHDFFIDIIRLNYNNEVSFHRLRKYIESTELENIFRTKESLITHVKSLMNETKIRKQIDNIEQPDIKEAIQKFRDIWIENPKEINLNRLKWSIIKRQLTKIADNSYKTANITINQVIKETYYALTAYMGVLMDIYTITRMFRKYEPIKNKYSAPAKNIIIYAGGFHTKRYEKFLQYLNFSLRGVNRDSSNRATCIDNPFPTNFFG